MGQIVPFHGIRRRRTIRSRHLRAAVGCCLVATSLALGGAHPEVNLGLAAAMVTILGVWLWTKGKERQLPSSLPLLAVGTALLVTVLQLVPLPVGLIEVISPGAFDVLSLDKERAWAPLSMDPPATAHEVLKLCTYAAGALLAVGLFNSEHRKRELLGWISAAGGIVAVLGFVHALARFDRPWGTFGYSADHFTSTFINPNHLAGFLGFCSIITLGLTMTTRDNWRWAYFGNAVLMGAGVVLSLSRGGIVCYVGALIFFGLVVLLNRTARTRSVLWVQLGLAGALLVASYLARVPKVPKKASTSDSDEAASRIVIPQRVVDT